MSACTKYHWYGLLIVMSLVCAYALHPSIVYAAGPPTLPFSQAEVAKTVTWIITGINALLWVVFVFLSYLLDPNFIFSLNGNGSFMNMLNQVWQLSRDLMNIIFALGLIGAAIYTIVTANQEFVRSHIAKFLMAIILVNFSWFFPQVILDVANVTAATIYGIPSLLAKSGGLKCTVDVQTAYAPAPTCVQRAYDDGTPYFECTCRRVLDAQFFVTDRFKTDNRPNQFGDATPTASPWYCFSDIVCVKYGPLDMNTVAGHSAILNGLIVNQARLGDLATVPAVGAGNDVMKMINFMIKEMLLLVIHVALFFPLVALLVAFAIRIPVLWLTMAFMPFIFLSFIVDQAFITEYPKKLWEYFLKAAFLPAMVAIPFTVGFIMINAGSQLTGSSVPALATIKLPLISSIGDFWQLLWLGMSMGIIWVGVFTVLEKAGSMGAGAGAIKIFGESIGRIALKTPLALPTIPGSGGVSLLGAMKQMHPRNIEGAMEQRGGLKKAIDDIRHPGRNWMQGFLPAAHKAAEGTKDPAAMLLLHQDLEKLKRAIETKNNTERDQIISNIKRDHKGLDISKDNPEESLKPFLDKLKELGKHQGDFAAPFAELTKDMGELRDKTNAAKSK